MPASADRSSVDSTNISFNFADHRVDDYTRENVKARRHFNRQQKSLSFLSAKFVANFGTPDFKSITKQFISKNASVTWESTVFADPAFSPLFKRLFPVSYSLRTSFSICFLVGTAQ
jgi:hypothetical protein